MKRLLTFIAVVALAGPVWGQTTVSYQEGVGGKSGTATKMKEVAPTTIQEASSHYEFGNFGSGDRQFPLTYWDISDLPGGITITNARAVWYNSGEQRVGGATFYVAALKVEYVEDSATWDNRRESVAWQTGGALGANDRYLTDTVHVTYSATDDSLDVNVTSIVQNWYDATWTNYGLVGQNVTAPNTTYWRFAPDEDATTTDRPKLEITYTTAGAGNNVMVRP